MKAKEQRRSALAVDLGATRLRVAMVDQEGRVLKRHAEDTLSHQGPEPVMERLIGHLESMARSVPDGAIVGLGLAVASPFNTNTGQMVRPPNFPTSWDYFAPGPLLELRLSIKAYPGNDATLAALGEHRFGAGRGLRHIVYLTVSTGIGGGIVVDGKLYSGHRGFAGEIGHMIIDRSGPLCACGSNGCLESLASGTAIARMARERLAAGRISSLTRTAQGDPRTISAKMVAEAAIAGDGLAQEVMKEASFNLGLGIVSLLNIFDPELVIIGGGVSRQMELLMPGISEAISLRAMAHHKNHVPIVKSPLGDDAGLLGAVALVFEGP